MVRVCSKHNSWCIITPVEQIFDKMPNPSGDLIIWFQKRILVFWSQHGRHNLPWRHTDDPWKLLIAEVLLRKTTSTQVLSVYSYLSELSPFDVINIEAYELENILLPLGIHKVRAAQLKEIAIVFAEGNIDLYKSDDFLRSLPGVGRYISNSVRCCAFGSPVPALDANMIRIIQRVFSWVSRRKRPREDRELWAFAETLVPAEKSHEFNWGVLDFGALVCTHYNPKCGDCSISEICDYYQKQGDSQNRTAS